VASLLFTEFAESHGEMGGAARLVGSGGDNAGFGRAVDVPGGAYR
jgi:hypothetical protein